MRTGSRVLWWLVGLALVGCHRPDPGQSPSETSLSSSAALGSAPAASSRPLAPPAIREPTEWRADDAAEPADRIRGAEERRGEVVRALFAERGVPFPAEQMLLRAFKEERELEVWVSGDPRGPLTHLATYRICYASGYPGPKRAEGDRQVPEGFYEITSFNDASKYHLSMRVDYPNASDRVRGRVPLGGDIMVHGRCRSVGCLAMSDERIEELWVMAEPLSKGRGALWIHIFPGRDLSALRADGRYDAHTGLWAELEAGRARFEATRRLEPPLIDEAGRYDWPDSSP